MPTTTLPELLRRGVRLETHETIALARQLLASRRGVPTLDNIQLRFDGCASCINTEGVTTVTSVANLLLTLLPAGTPNVPAPLRYTIARGLEVVEAPPFKSLDEFSTVLERFEKGASPAVLRGVLQRAAPQAPPSPAAVVVAPTTERPAPEPLRVAPQPTVVPQRPTLVVRNPQRTSGEPQEPTVDSPSLFKSFGGDEEADSPVYSSNTWALTAVAALVASFAMGFAITHQIIERRTATVSARSSHVSPEVSAAAPEENTSTANPVEVGVREEIVRVPRATTGVDEIAALSSTTRAGAGAGSPSEPVERVDGRVTAVQAVRASNTEAFSPAFASDGTAIFFHTGRDHDERSALEVATAGGQMGRDVGIMTIVDDGAHNYHAQPSPDGRFVAFDSDREGDRGIYVANRDGSQVRRISGAGYAAVPTWSHNGEWLAYIRAEANKSSVWNLWIQPVAGGNARRLTSYRYGETWAGSWFPDDRRIAYSHENTLMVMDLQTGEATRYETPVKGQLVRTPAVSPDGTKIIFQVFRNGAWLLDLADGSMQRVLTDPTAEEFAWSPDGGRVAFHSRRDGGWGIYVLWRS